MTEPRKPRLIDLMPDKPKRTPVTLRPLMSRRRRATLALDAKTARPIVYDESYPIAGASLALDERPKLPRSAVTFDGAMPSSINPKDPTDA